jgi:HKD family nuclease
VGCNPTEAKKMTTKFISGDENTNAIKKIFKEDPLKCAVAFWGKKAWELLKDSKQKIKIICNLESGATNPFLIEKLQKKKNIELRTQHNLHAKVYFSNNQAIIGSSNASANGLSLEDAEVTGYIEASVTTNDEKIITSINSWFEELWKYAREIDDSLLEESRKKWKNWRNNRPYRENPENPQMATESLLAALRDHPEIFKDRNIYFYPCRYSMSHEAGEAFSEAQEEYLGTEIDGYECGDDGEDGYPENSYLIVLYYGPRGGFRYRGICKTNSPHLIKGFKDEDGSDGKIILALKEDIIKIDSATYKITPDDRELLRSKISELWKLAEKAVPERILSLYDARKCLFGDKVG